MNIKTQVIRKKRGAASNVLQAVRMQGRQVVIKHALGAATAAYQIYPVGPEHKDGTPHTRDTFQILVNGEVIAEKGMFWNTTSLGYRTDSDRFVVSFRAAGASFFVEFGTIYMEARPILRMVIKQARVAIQNELRHINITVKQL